MKVIRLICLTWVCAALLVPSAHADPGILLLAHGGGPEWNARVTALAAEVNRTRPTEVAFGMATRATLQDGVERLVKRGATEVVAVPLFVSSWSSIITSTEYLLGLRAEAPEALAMYARMNHGAAPAAAAHGADAEHHDHAAGSDGTTPIASPVPIRLTPALNDHAIVAEILMSRARSISRDPRQEAVILVAHGPNEDDDNQRWLTDMASLTQQMRTREAFASIDALTLRDDAPKPVRDGATAALREVVERRLHEGRRVLIVPLLVSFGGIDRGLQERLDGLTYTMPNAGLVPDDRLVAWVLAMAEKR